MCRTRVLFSGCLYMVSIVGWVQVQDRVSPVNGTRTSHT